MDGLPGPRQRPTGARASGIPSPSESPVVLSIHFEQRGEQFKYRFENPSNFEPGPLVPHFFEQEYDSGTMWMFVTADYRIAGVQLTTAVGVTPRITTAGSDIDTFFQPSGDVIMSGTRGEVDLGSFSLRQRMTLSTWRDSTFGVTLGYRRSAMDYLPSDRIITHSPPPSETREPVPGHENTWSHVVDSGVFASTTLYSGPRWDLQTRLEALPITRARLTISLPDKYPGELIRGDTFSFGGRGELAAAYRWRRLRVGASVKVGRTWGYRRSAQYGERGAGGEVFVSTPIL